MCVLFPIPLLHPLRRATGYDIGQGNENVYMSLESSAVAAFCGSEMVLGNVIMEKGSFIVVRMVGS